MKYDCIIPAAGLSERMGCWKLLLEYNGKSIIENSIGNALQNSNRIIISGGYRIEELRKKIPQNENIILVNNSNYKKGMITSVKAALPFVKTEKFFIALSDMPIIQPEIFKRMSVMDFPDVLFPVYRGERGHPVLISSSLIDIIMKAPDSVRMKDVLNKVDISEIEIENNCILFDIDTKNDYKKLQSL